MAQIRLESVSKIYSVGGGDIRAVDNSSLSVERGDFLSIVGHSGSGKTTLLSIIGGIMRPTSGRVLFEGQDICSLDDDNLSDYRSSKIGFMFQFASLLPMLTAAENILLPSLFNAGMESVNMEKAREYLALVGIEEKLHAF